MATKSTGQRLAPQPKFRDRIAVQSAPITQQIADRRRCVAFCELFSDAPRKPDFVYELQRRDRRHQLPDERQRRLIHDGIREGYISRERVIRYRAAQLLDDLAAFPSNTPANERLLAVMLREIGEAIEAHIVAEGTPSSENRAGAVREGRQAIALIERRNAALEQGTVS